MSALLTYRSRNSFESRFGRTNTDPSRAKSNQAARLPTTPQEEHWAVHNDGFKNGKKLSSTPNTPVLSPTVISRASTPTVYSRPGQRRAPSCFSAQSYLRYQAEKFVKRFDSNCYIAITRKLDTHDISRGRTHQNLPPALGGQPSPPSSPTSDAIPPALELLSQPTLVIGIESDGLFTFQEQEELATHIPNAKLRRIDSPEGHDAFLIQFEEVNNHIVGFLQEVLPELYAEEVLISSESEPEDIIDGVLLPGVVRKEKKKKGGLTTEVDDITAW